MKQIDLDFIQAEAQRRADDYIAFRYYVELDDRSDVDLDRLVESIARPIVDAIDCVACANCCRVLDVYVMEHEAAQLAAVDVLDNIIDRERAAAVGEWGVLRGRPCCFLKGMLCGIYPQRPESCRLYPVFTPDFRWMLDDILGGVGLCPIIYHVVEQMQAALGW